MLSRRALLAGSAGAAVAVLSGCADATEPSPATTPTGSGTPTPTSSPDSPTPSTRTATPSPAPSSTSTPAPRPRVADTIADDLDVPWGIVFLASGAALVGERNTGRILQVSTRGRVSTLGEVAGVDAPSGVGEGGLLGIALDPADPDTLFAYTTTSNDDRVVRMSIARSKVGRPTPVLDGIPTSVHHHGGRLVFDRNGLLYVSTGDAEQPETAQDRDALTGKILRLRPNGRAAPGNPFENRTWSYGHRNIEGLAFDAENRLWATEFGDQKSDELNLIRKGGNYGWPDDEGRSTNSRFRSPAAVWSPTSSCSPAGLAITRSTAFIGALRGQCLFAVPLRGADAGRPKGYFAGEYGRIRSVVVAPDGALWMTTSNTDGRTDPGRNDDKIIRVEL
ncbi:MAG TPA: PQQ-dependent sugar dehydrogenase [Propionibacteriaceae bacterium]|nr:PQQ-dependent sugar dehydrogenase [Propionibacteriaceae bacterium]